MKRKTYKDNLIDAVNDSKKSERAEAAALKKVISEWSALYMQVFGIPYSVNRTDRYKLRHMIRDYGEDVCLQTVRYYLKNYLSISYINGYPTIGALVGFRKSLVPEAVIGKKKNISGNQYTGNTDKKLPDGWD